jgi:hypothetical protein
MRGKRPSNKYFLELRRERAERIQSTKEINHAFDMISRLNKELRR